MPLRILQHGFAGTTASVGLEPGRWADVAQHGQFLIDLEFLLRYGPRSGTASCVYCKSPPYLSQLAHQFPWIHFYVFEHKPEMPEYDPAQPECVSSTAPTVQVEFNRTMSCLEFTKDMARTMGERGARERESLLMICHGQDSVRQLTLHVLMRPNYSLLDVCGVIPVDYLEGELVLPLNLPNNKIFLGLVVHQHAKCKTYDQDTFLGEIGFFQGVIRVTQAYDEASKDLIAGEYARSTHKYHGCSEEIVRTALLSTVDLLWAGS
jgi:hypothetical protein